MTGSLSLVMLCRVGLSIQEAENAGLFKVRQSQAVFKSRYTRRTDAVWCCWCWFHWFELDMREGRRCRYHQLM